MIVFLFLFHHRQADERRLAAEQAEQALRALLQHVNMHVGNGHAKRREARVDGFLSRFAGKFLASH